MNPLFSSPTLRFGAAAYVVPYERYDNKVSTGSMKQVLEHVEGVLDRFAEQEKGVYNAAVPYEPPYFYDRLYRSSINGKKSHLATAIEKEVPLLQVNSYSETEKQGLKEMLNPFKVYIRPGAVYVWDRETFQEGLSNIERLPNKAEWYVAKLVSFLSGTVVGRAKASDLRVNYLLRQQGNSVLLNNGPVSDADGVVRDLMQGPSVPRVIVHTDDYDQAMYVTGDEDVADVARMRDDGQSADKIMRYFETKMSQEKKAQEARC